MRAYWTQAKAFQKKAYRSDPFYNTKISIKQEDLAKTELGLHCKFISKVYTVLLLQTASNVISSKSNFRNMKKSVEFKEVEPDIDDPNCYYRFCEKNTLSSKYIYNQHIVSMYSISQKPHKKDKAVPDVNDLNNYCRLCKRT